MGLEAGLQLGDYRILSRIGGGAYGEVFEGEHAITRRRDAIKVLSNGPLQNPEQQQRFLQEIQVQASLHHPNIAAVYNAFATPYGLALVMELIPGEPLSSVMARSRIPIGHAVRLVLETLAALAYAHAKGVVHRDVKPENIIVTPEGSVKLTDFGLARSAASPRLTQSGVFAGSPCYMSPEQARGTTAADARSDTYSAGVVLYEVVTGQLPFSGDSTIEMLLAHQYAAPRPPEELEPSAGGALSRVILTAIEKEPERRYQTAGAFYAALWHAANPAQSAAAQKPAAQKPVAQEQSGVVKTGKRRAFALRVPPRLRASASRLIRVVKKYRVGIGACAGPIVLVAGIGFAVEHWKAPPIQAPIQEKLRSTSEMVERAIIHTIQDVSATTPASDSAPLVPDAKPPAPVYRAPRVRKPEPPIPTALTFTGSADSAVPPSHTEVPAVTPPASMHMDPPALRTPEPTAAPASTIAPSPAAEPAGASAPPAADPAKAAPKHRNVVVRVFQKMFHSHTKGDGSDGSAAGEPQAPKSTGPDSTKQQ